MAEIQTSVATALEASAAAGDDWADRAGATCLALERWAMLKVLPEAHSSDQSATNLSGGKIKRNKDLDDLARRIKKLPNAPPPRESRAKFIVAAAILFCLWLIDSVGFYVAFGGASLLRLSLYLIDRKHNRQAKPKKSSETQALDRR